MKTTPTLAEMVRNAVLAQLYDLHTALPGTVLIYNQADGTATVQPGIMKKYKSDSGGLLSIADQLLNTKPLPPIPHVPVSWYENSLSSFKFPLFPGDTGTLIFHERSIDKWLAGVGLPVSPDDNRHHHLSDAMFIPGLSPSSKRGMSPMTNMELRHGLMTIELTPLGGVKITGPVTELVSVISAMLGHVIGLKVLDPVSGLLPLDPTTIVTLTADKVLLDSFKV